MEEEEEEHYKEAHKSTKTCPYWKNKLLRLSFALSKYHHDEYIDAYKFKSQDNITLTNEKQFYLTWKTQTYYLAPRTA